MCINLFFMLIFEVGVDATRLIMEDEAILKVIWGADADLTSLFYQHAPQRLQIRSKSVLDAQLAFCEVMTFNQQNIIHLLDLVKFDD